LAEYANSRVSAFRVPDTHHSPTTRPSMNRQMAIPSIVVGPRSPEPMPLRFAITATRRSEHAADTAAFGPKQEYRLLADLLTRGAPLDHMDWVQVFGRDLRGLRDDAEGVAWRVDAVVFLGEVKVPVGVEVAVADQGA
jgi:hypothetical protein